MKIVIILVFLGLIGGLIDFSAEFSAAPEDMRPTDAIVVPTGGSGRLAAGVDLLARGLAKKLFITGVNRTTEASELERLTNQKPSLFTCCIVIGHEATDTKGNARETALWIKHESYTSLRLVTADYHIRRATLEFKMLMPDIQIIPYAIHPPSNIDQQWWLHTHSAALILNEYGKYVVTLVRYGLFCLARGSQ